VEEKEEGEDIVVVKWCITVNNLTFDYLSLKHGRGLGFLASRREV
jgi:hypothetical protein